MNATIPRRCLEIPPFQEGKLVPASPIEPYTKPCRFENRCRTCTEWRRSHCCLYLRIALQEMGEPEPFPSCMDCSTRQACISVQHGISPDDDLTSDYALEEILSSLPELDKEQVFRMINQGSHYIPKPDMGTIDSIQSQLDVLWNHSIKTVAIPLQKLLVSTRDHRLRLKPEFNKELHDVLDWKGEFFLLPNINDHFCFRSFLEPDIHCGIIKRVAPDILATADGAFQMLKPIFIKMDQYREVFKLNAKIAELPFKQIGLLPPDLETIPRSVQVFKSMGFKYFGLPVQELSKGVNDPVSGSENRWFLKQFDHTLSALPLVIVSGSPRLPIHANYYASLSWRFPSKSKSCEKLSNLANHERRLVKLMEEAKKNALYRNSCQKFEQFNISR